MKQKGKYRHELKFRITYGEYLILRQKLKTVMKSDPYTDEKGFYTIRSIYFDNINDKALREKNNGVPQREKFRIRYYNDDFSFLTLEKKIKHNALTMKIDAPITEQECRKILDGDLDFMLNHENELVRELYCKMQSQRLRPRVLVSYMREPFIYDAGNVRVTFDFNVRTTLWHREFLEQKIHDISAMDGIGEMILEVKYDAFLPEIISHLIQSDGLRQDAFSKYGACRKFG